MPLRATTRYVRMSSKKVRIVADAIRGMNASAALERLRIVPRAASRPLTKTILSALANAEHNFQKKKETLSVGTVMIDDAPPLKRWRARAFGRAASIRKHACHITIVLQEQENKNNSHKAAKKPKKPLV